MRRDRAIRVLACAISMFLLVLPLGTGSTTVTAKDPGSIFMSGTWRNQTFYKIEQPFAIGGDMTLLVDSQKCIHIFFIESSGGNMMYARNLSGQDWSVSTIGSSGLTVWPRGVISLFDLSGLPVVVGGDNESALKIAQKVGSNWVVDSIPGAVGVPLAAEQSPGGAFRLLYSKDHDLYLAEGHGDLWSIGRILSLPGPTTVSADFGLDHSVHAASSNFTSRQLFYSTNRTGNWTNEVLDGNCAVRFGLKLIVDSDGDARVAYVDEFNNNIKYGASDVGNWSVTPVYGSSLFDSLHDVDMALGEGSHAMLSFRASGGYCYAPASLGVGSKELLIGTGREDGGMSVGGPTTIAAHGSSAYVLYIAYSEKYDSLYYKIASNANDFLGEDQGSADSLDDVVLIGVAVAVAVVVVATLVLAARSRRKT